MRLYHICNPGNRRARFFREACGRLGLANPVEVAWNDLPDHQSSCEFPGADLIRVDSPGEDFEVERKLISLGDGPRDLNEDYGRLRYQEAWCRGWKTLLDRIAESNSNTRFMNPCSDIAMMFDKWSSQKHLSDQGVPVPEPLGRIESFEDLVELLRETGARRVFLKPCHSSSASGVVALQMADRNRVLATTSAELVPECSRIYNSLRLRRYRDPRLVRLLVDLLAKQNLMVERWFPKAGFEGKSFDLRVLVIAGKARHVVVRTGRSPITNLHLGNARGGLSEIREFLGEEIWISGMNVAVQAASGFPNCHYVAVDLMIGVSRNSFAVAEVNAFGDLLPGILSDGDDTYTAELRTWC